MRAPALLVRAARAANLRARGILDLVGEALAFERRPREEIDAVVAAKLQALVEHAAARVPFHAARLAAAGIDPARVRSIADLATLPLLTKADLRDRGEELVSGGRIDPAWIRNASGGSTGAPVTFYQDGDYQRRMLADQARHVTWTGLPWWTPRAFVWGADRDSRAHAGLRARLRDTATGTLFLNTFQARDQDYVAFARACAAAATPLVVGYASSLEHFARVVESERARGLRWNPHALQSSAERLDPAMRRRIEGAFGCPVFDRYGSREMGNAAHECRAHAGLHVSMERVIVEVLRDGVPVADGEEGELVVTVLDNRVEPLLRYAIGDVGRKLPGPCACGRAYERIEITAGRTSDLFTTPAGVRVHGEYFTHLFYGLAGVASFRIVQETRERLVIELVRGAGWRGDEVDGILDGIRDLDPAFRTEVRMVEEIPLSASGKRSFTISMVPVEWGPT
jgi:phenylacetate-CoA ligase